MSNETKTQHTPLNLPLHYEAHIPHGSADAQWLILDAKGGVVAIVDPDCSLDQAETPCHFIAAACNAHADLLAACEALLKEWPTSDKTQIRLARNLARAAIAKANAWSPTVPEH